LLNYKVLFFGTLAIAVLVGFWTFYEQFREPAEMFLICPDGTANNGSNVCICTAPHTTTVTINGVISCIPAPVPDIPGLCDLVPEHPNCQRAPKIPLDVANNLNE
jgi:hypothetical protein